MFWMCEWFDKEGIHVLGENKKFVLFKRKKNAGAYLKERDCIW